MERWQLKAIAKVKQVNFGDSVEEIQKAFDEICKPLIGIEGIEIGKSKIKIGAETYTFKIPEKNTIEVMYESPKRSGLCSYIVSKNGAGYCKKGGMTELQLLEDYEFNFVEILNNLMNNAMEIV